MEHQKAEKQRKARIQENSFLNDKVIEKPRHEFYLPFAADGKHKPTGG